jgi:hypothetical protein
MKDYNATLLQDEKRYEMKKQFTLERTYDAYVTIEIVKRTNGRYYAEIDRNLDDLWAENDEYECWVDEPNNIMTEINPTEEEYDAIIETFREYIIANGVKYARICDKCGNGMNDGYIVNGGDEYYCSAECLHKDYSPKEWQEMYDESEENGGNDHYWTEWEGECCYILFDNQLINI